MSEHQTEIVVVGGSVVGVAAALSALRLGRQVILTEVSSWIGGQCTSQEQPPDEALWVEDCEATATYREFQSRVRQRHLADFQRLLIQLGLTLAWPEPYRLIPSPDF